MQMVQKQQQPPPPTPQKKPQHTLYTPVLKRLNYTWMPLKKNLI